MVFGQPAALRATRRVNTTVLGGGNSHIFLEIFTPILGEDEPILTSIYFSTGWEKKPPTRFDCDFHNLIHFDSFCRTHFNIHFTTSISQDPVDFCSNAGTAPTRKAITFDGPEEAVALCAWRLHRSLEPWEVAEAPPRVEEEDERREKGRGKGKSKGRLMTEMMRYLW